jgi:hypothetical protein
MSGVKSSRYTPIIAVVLTLMMLYYEGGVWRVLAFIALGLGIFAGFAHWLFQKGERRKSS